MVTRCGAGAPSDGEASPKVLILVHGGPALQTMRTWDAGIQQAVMAGTSVLALNYRGSSGYGASFEARGAHVQNQVRDIISASQYARSTLGIPSDRVIVWGHSYGALLVARAIRVDPTLAKRAIIISLAGELDAQDEKPRLPEIVAFHGKEDVAQAPESARAAIARLVGDRRGVDFTFHVFADEGHSFRRLRSWAQVYSAALRP